MFPLPLGETHDEVVRPTTETAFICQPGVHRLNHGSPSWGGLAEPPHERREMRVDMVRVLIDRFLLAVSQNGGVLTEDIALQIEQAFRKEYCGARCEVYAHSRSLLTKKKTDVISAHSAGQSPGCAAWIGEAAAPILNHCCDRAACCRSARAVTFPPSTLLFAFCVLTH